MNEVIADMKKEDVADFSEIIDMLWSWVRSLTRSALMKQAVGKHLQQNDKNHNPEDCTTNTACASMKILNNAD
jgi:hypothetical protein